MITGLLDPTDGEILYDGVDLAAFTLFHKSWP